MNYPKMLGLAVVASMAFAAFLGASSASATVLCLTTPVTGTHCGENWKLGTGALLDASVEDSLVTKTTGNPGTTISTCTTGTIKGTIDAGWTGSTTQTVTGTIEEFTFADCNTTVDVLAAGKLEIHYEHTTDNGTVTSTGLSYTVNIGGVSCTYGTNNTDIGTLTGGNPATLDIEGILPKTAGSFLCPADSVWAGHYKITTPSGTLHVTTG